MSAVHKHSQQPCSAAEVRTSTALEEALQKLQKQMAVVAKEVNDLKQHVQRAAKDLFKKQYLRVMKPNM